MNIENIEFYHTLNPAEQAAVIIAYSQLPNPPFHKEINKKVTVTGEHNELHYKVTFIGTGDSLILQPLEKIEK